MCTYIHDLKGILVCVSNKLITTLIAICVYSSKWLQHLLTSCSLYFELVRSNGCQSKDSLHQTEQCLVSVNLEWGAIV